MINNPNAAVLIDQWNAKAWPHQKHWFDARAETYRNLLVDRQVGSTLAMAAEGAVCSLETGRRQVFIAASIPQAEYFKSSILRLFKDYKVSDWAFSFVSPLRFFRNAQTYQDYDVYVGDYLWMHESSLKKVMMTLEENKPVRQTWFSARTPDTKQQLLERVTHKVSRGSDGVIY